MKIHLFVLAFALMILFVGAGCIQSKDGSVSLDPTVANKISEGGEAGLAVMKVLAPFLGPAGFTVVGGLASALALFKKYKPKFVQVQTKAEMSHTVASVSVDAIEILKRDHPKVWPDIRSKIEIELSEADIDTKALENFIRGLRGLPPKDL